MLAQYCMTILGQLFIGRGFMREEKKFKTISEQLEGLKRKNLMFNGESDENFAIDVLEKTNFYTLVNGYKEIFLDVNYQKINNNDPDERYEKDTFFKDLYFLYYFDSELRHVFLKFIFMFESNIKAKIIYYFSEKFYENNNAYLDKNNFNYTDSFLQSNIEMLIKKMEKIIDNQKKLPNTRINHYSQYYSAIPLWVLMPQLDFGTISHFFKYCTKDIQSKIAKHLKSNFIKNYPEYNNSFILTSEVLSNMLFFINSFRNICAHNERLYNHRYYNNNINTTVIHDFYHLKFKYSVFDLILLLMGFMTPSEYELFKKLIASPLAFLYCNIGKERFIKIVQKMKFSRKWEEILKIKDDFEKFKLIYSN
ncbi:Abi family protein [Leptotrichia sp. OH3620_COT-345]|nr:Abi family protein [Leptotrichia sp. OH3620_COT-345]